VTKRYPVHLAPGAERDIVMTRDFIARDNPKAAQKWVAALRRQIRSLSRFPLRFDIIPEADEFAAEFRQLLFGSYESFISLSRTRSWCCA
jgi:plasmid stabilization system protein ParE